MGLVVRVSFELKVSADFELMASFVLFAGCLLVEPLLVGVIGRLTLDLVEPVTFVLVADCCSRLPESCCSVRIWILTSTTEGKFASCQI